MTSQHETIPPAAPLQASDAQDAERRAFELRVRHCYELQGRTWHGNVIWVSSPLVVEMVMVLASFLICCPERRLPSKDMQRVLHDWIRRGLDDDSLAQTITDAVATALDAALRDVDQPPRGGPLYPRLKAATTAVQDEEMIARAAGLVLDRCCTGETAGRTLWRDALFTVFPAGVFSPVDRLRETIDATRWWFTHRDFILVSERPVEVHRESQAARPGSGPSRLHSLEGPAISWPDGWGVYALRGLEVPAWIIKYPERITVEAIEREQNAEWRRTLIERYGWQRYIADCGADVVDVVSMDHPVRGLRGARLLRKVLPGEPEPIVYLEMINSTPEPDGSLRRYLTRVNPSAYGGDAGRLCPAAMASLWRYRGDDGVLRPTFARWQDYVPDAES